MHTDIAAHTITNCKNHVEIIVIKFAAYLPVSFNLNCSEFPNSCRGVKFSILKNVAYVFTNSYPVFFNEQELYELDWDNESTIESVLLMRRAKR